MFWRFIAHAGNARGTLVAVFAAAAILLLSANSAFALSPHDDRALNTSTCAACHSSHAATAAVLLRGDPVTDPITSLCVSCHAAVSDPTATEDGSEPQNSFGLASGHALDPVAEGAAAVRGCATCHDAHGTASETRMVPAMQINGVAIDSAGRSLCIACHDADDDWYGPDYPSTSTPTRDAAGFPVAGTWPGTDTYASESNAHRLIPESTQTVVGVSAPVRREQGDCLYCHASHGSANAYDSLIATFTVPTQATLAADQVDGAYASLCFQCHGGATPSGFTEAPVDIKQFAIGIGAGGHRIRTSGGTLPVGSSLPCFECHNPHGSKRGNASLISDERGAALSTGDAAAVRAFCFTCHTTSDAAAGWDSVTSTYTVVTSSEAIVGLPRTGGALRLPDAGGHAGAATESCYACHGDSYQTGGNNVHDPSIGAEPASPIVPVAASELATGSIDASASAEATGSLDTSATVETTASALGSAEPTSTVPPILPPTSLPVTGTAGWLVRRRGDPSRY